MRSALGWTILILTVLYALIRNPRVAVFGMVAADNIRPGDEYIEFGMETVKFSITYYAVALGILLIFYKRYKLTSDRFHWAIFFLFMSVVNSALHAPCFGAAYIQIDNYYKMLLQYYLICAFMRNESHVRELFWAISFSMVVVSLRFSYGKFLLNERQWEGATGDRNEMAMAVVMCLPLLFMLGFTAKALWQRLFAWMWLPFMAVTVLMSLSRGGMLGLGAVGGYMLYRLHHKRWLVVVGVFGALVGLANLPTEVTARFMTIGMAAQRDASAIGRLNAWAAARNMVKDRPLYGVGSGNFLVWFRRYAPDPNDVHVAHSSLFQLMGEQGVPGLAIWIYLVVMCWLVLSWNEMRLEKMDRGRWTDARYMHVALKACWIGYVLCGAFLSQEDMDFFYHLLAITSRYAFFIDERQATLRAEIIEEKRQTLPSPSDERLTQPGAGSVTPAWQ